MISFLRKGAPPAPAWHPDFRDTTTLPDVKVIRTSFFINGISIFILLAAALFLAVQEFGRHALEGEVRMLEGRIEESSARNAEVLKLEKAFKEEERTINEAIVYLDGSLDLSAFLIALAETLHPNMTFTGIRYQDAAGRGEKPKKQILISGLIWAEPDAATSIVTNYLGAFHEDPFLAARVDEALSTSLVPTPEGDKMSFGIQLLLKNELGETVKEETK